MAFVYSPKPMWSQSQTSQVSRRGWPLGAAAVALALASTEVWAAPSADPVQFLVMREGRGSAAAAQRYLGPVMDRVADVSGWSQGAVGTYHTKRESAEAFIRDKKPGFGILTMAAYLALRDPHKLSMLGTVEVQGGGGQQYYLISGRFQTLAECKGQKLVSDHANDARFIDRVVSGDAFDLSDFQVVKTRRPLQTIQSVLRGEADCALVDDLQLADLAHVEGGATLHPIWFSRRLPSMVVVSLPSASPAEVSAFRANLPRVCEDSGKAACEGAGLRRLKAEGEASLASVVRDYQD